jgi:hypothetical protein
MELKMKKTYLLFIISTLIFLGCGSKQKNNEIDKYAELPIENDLSLYLKNQPIVTAGEYIYRIKHYTLSAYEKGRKFAGGNPREEQLSNLFNINRYRVKAIYKANLNYKKYNQFEIDNFENKLKENFKNVVPNVEKKYSSFPRHIKLINLNIPVKYSKNSYDKNQALVEINKQALKQFTLTKNYTYAKFVKDIVNDKFIDKHIIRDNKKLKLTVGLDLPYYDDYILLKILDKADALNQIGIKNKGKDYITELTIYIENPYSDANKNEIKFGITSFKLKSTPNKRFITNSYIDLLSDGYNAPSKEFLVRENDVKLLIKNK